MELNLNSIKALFKGKIYPKFTKKNMKQDNFLPLPSCYTMEDKSNHHCSFIKKNKMKNFARNKDISLCPNNYLSNTDETFNSKNSLSKMNSSKDKIKNDYLIEKKINENKHNYNLNQNILNISVNRSMHQSNHKRKSNNEITNIKNSNININNNNNQNNI